LIADVAGSKPSGARALLGHRWSDKVYHVVLQVAAFATVFIILAIGWELYVGSQQSQHAFGLRFLKTADWDPVHEIFGALPFIVGTLYTSFLALLIALPISLGTAVMLSELAPRWISTPVSFMVELLASVPSVVYGLWGIFVLAPWLAAHVETPISKSALAHFPLFNAPPNGNDVLTAAVILAIMVLPFITAVSRDILQAVPRAAREGSYALGSTRWETIARIVIPYGRSGIMGGVVLGLGRALGETMAVTMVIGNSPNIHLALFKPGYTMSSVIANEFSEASADIHRSALIEIALLLFAVSLIVNILARGLIAFTDRNLHGKAGA